MLIGQIDFPQQVISAQKNNELVVFAGAGISMPTPSNLPDFERLAKDTLITNCFQSQASILFHTPR